jgi:glutamate-1-semialdehyde 2,1-aminomutase
MYQAGTLSGNPLAMTAGIKTLELLKQGGTYERLDAITKRLSAGILAAADDPWACRSAAARSVPCSASTFGNGPVHNFEQAKAADTARFGKLHRAMLQRRRLPGPQRL